MKLKSVRHQPAASYPTFAEYQTHRDAYLRRLAIGTGALLAASLATAGDPATGTPAATPGLRTEAPARYPGAGSAAPAPAKALLEKAAAAAKSEVCADTAKQKPATPAAGSPVAIRGEAPAPTPPTPSAGTVPAPVAPIPDTGRPVELKGALVSPRPPPIIPAAGRPMAPEGDIAQPVPLRKATLAPVWKSVPEFRVGEAVIRVGMTRDELLEQIKLSQQTKDDSQCVLSAPYTPVTGVVNGNELFVSYSPRLSKLLGGGAGGRLRITFANERIQKIENQPTVAG